MPTTKKTPTHTHTRSRWLLDVVCANFFSISLSIYRDDLRDIGLNNSQYKWLAQQWMMLNWKHFNGITSYTSWFSTTKCVIFLYQIVRQVKEQKRFVKCESWHCFSKVFRFVRPSVFVASLPSEIARLILLC